jgi:hypothetical protein
LVLRILDISDQPVDFVEHSHHHQMHVEHQESCASSSNFPAAAGKFSRQPVMGTCKLQVC